MRGNRQTVQEKMVWFIMQKSMAGMMRKQEPFFREMMLKRAECRRLKTRGSLWDGGTGEKGEISIILPEECKKGVVYKPKADHYFTFDKPNRDGPVTLVRHEGYVIGFDTER